MNQFDFRYTALTQISPASIQPGDWVRVRCDLPPNGGRLLRVARIFAPRERILAVQLEMVRGARLELVAFRADDLEARAKDGRTFDSLLRDAPPERKRAVAR